MADLGISSFYVEDLIENSRFNFFRASVIRYMQFAFTALFYYSRSGELAFMNETPLRLVSLITRQMLT